MQTASNIYQSLFGSAQSKDEQDDAVLEQETQKLNLANTEPSASDDKVQSELAVSKHTAQAHSSCIQTAQAHSSSNSEQGGYENIQKATGPLPDQQTSISQALNDSGGTPSLEGGFADNARLQSQAQSEATSVQTRVPGYESSLQSNPPVGKTDTPLGNLMSSQASKNQVSGDDATTSAFNDQADENLSETDPTRVRIQKSLNSGSNPFAQSLDTAGLAPPIESFGDEIGTSAVGVGEETTFVPEQQGASMSASAMATGRDAKQSDAERFKTDDFNSTPADPVALSSEGPHGLTWDDAQGKYVHRRDEEGV